MPKCGKTFGVTNRIYAEEIDIRRGKHGSNSWRGLSYNCSSCHAVVSIQINPLLVKDEIVEDLKKQSRRS